MKLNSLLDVPHLKKELEDKLSVEVDNDLFLSNRLYFGIIGGGSGNALKNDLISAIWHYKPEIILWEIENLIPIYENYDKSSHWLNQNLRETHFFTYLDDLIKRAKSPVIVVINPTSDFFNFKELFSLIEKSKRMKSQVYFWVKVTKLSSFIKKDLFFINAFKNFDSNFLNKILPNHKCSKIELNMEGQRRCYTSDNTFKYYSYMSSEDITNLLNILGWYE